MFRPALMVLATFTLITAPALAAPGTPFDLDFGADPATHDLAFNSAGDTGDHGHSTETTWQNAWQDAAPGNFQAPSGQTWTTRTQGWTDINGAHLQQVSTALQAPASVNQDSVSSGEYTHGFPDQPSMPYRGLYGSSPGTATSSPPVSTASMDFDVVAPERAPGPPLSY